MLLDAFEFMGALVFGGVGSSCFMLVGAFAAGALVFVVGAVCAVQCSGVFGSGSSHVCGFWSLSTHSLSRSPVALICSLVSWW